VAGVSAAEADNYEQARELSQQLGKPILIKFFVPSCDHCDKATEEFAVKSDIHKALESVVYMTVDCSELEELADEYEIGGVYYPVFLLANSDGEEIFRWIGYTTSYAFVNNLGKALADPTTVKERESSFRDAPTFDNAVRLAKYYVDAQNYVGAIEYYRRAQELDQSGRADFSFDILTNSCNAAWTDQIVFDDVLPVADTILVRGSSANIVKTAQLMARLARKMGETDRIAGYLTAGVDASVNSANPETQKTHKLLLADQALHVNADTTGAVRIKKATLGENYESDLNRVYDLVRWCAERKINLEESERYARLLASRASGDTFKAGILGTLALVLEARGKVEEAIPFVEEALELDPANKSYPSQLERLHETQ